MCTFYPIEQIGNSRSISAEDDNIILNPRFGDGISNWSGRGCKILVHESTGNGKVLPKSGKCFASAIQRMHSWNGIQQDITGRVQCKLAYELSAFVRILGTNVSNADVRATLWVRTPDHREQYIGVGRFVSSALPRVDIIIIYCKCVFFNMPIFLSIFVLFSISI